MKCLSLLALAALLVSGCGTLAVDERIVYAPSDGTVLTRTHLFEWESASTESSSLACDWTSTERIVVTDQLLEVDDGRPEKVLRSFTDLRSSSLWAYDYSEAPVERVLTSPLEGKTVVVDWDSEEETYRFVPAQGEMIDTAHLEALVEDMDYRGFLPKRKVSPGDTWTLDAEAYRSMNWYGGVVGFVDADYLDDDYEMLYQVTSRAAQDATGEAVLEGFLHTKKMRLAVISFHFETSAEFDIPDEGQEPSGSRRYYRRFGTVEGELRWDLDHDHVHWAKSDLLRTVVSFVRDAGATEESQRQEWQGRGRFTVTVDRFLGSRSG